MSHKKLLSWMISGEERFHLEMIDVDFKMSNHINSSARQKMKLRGCEQITLTPRGREG